MNLTDNDKAAIIHVSSVSKHPHAAMIIKQLITGWGVEFEYAVGEWKISDYPSWAYDIKYRLIEPKPAKPAYRVYRNKNNGSTYTRDAIDCPRNNHISSYNYEWISEWIEYDPPKKWPTPLVERIAAIDIKAAEWIVDHWDDLLDDRYTRKGMYDRESNLLSHSFDWSESDIGCIFWDEISTKLGE